MAPLLSGSQGGALALPELPGWKGWLSTSAALIIAALFLVAGIWKITDAPAAAVRLAQAKVPQELSLLAALGLGIVETFAGVLILVPRFRRWGAWIISALLIAFMIYIGVHYEALRGQECSCFPWLKRAVGPGFFVADALMLALALLAGWWSKPSQNKRGAVLVLGAVSVFALVSYGVAATRQSGVEAPASIQVQGKPFPLGDGRVFIYYFDPECTHCLDAGRRMSRLNWGQTRIVAVPVAQPQFAENFMRDTGLAGKGAVVSNDLDLLRKTYPFVSAPAAVAIENGRQKMALTQFDSPEPEQTLRKLGFVHD